MAYAPDVPNDIKRGKAQVLPDTTAGAPALRRDAPAVVPMTNMMGGFAPSFDPTGIARNVAALGGNGNGVYVPDHPLSTAESAALNNTPTPTPTPAPNKFANIDLTTPVAPAGTNRLGSPLARGVSRYTIGGDIGGPNAAKVYTTRGKDGSIVFTDDAGYAARNSAGGLRRGDVNAQVLANSQIDPRGGYEYAAPTTGLSDRQLAQLPAAGLAQALGDAQNAASKETYTDPRTGKPVVNDLGLADTIQANQLRARLQTAQQQEQQQQAAALAGLTPRDQISLMRARTAARQGDERIDIERQAAGLAVKRDQRSAYDDLVKNYQSFVANGQQDSANQYLASQLKGMSPKEIQKYLSTQSGQFVLSSLRDLLRSGAKEATLPIEVGDRNAIPGLSFADVVQQRGGGFAGLRSPDQAAGDDPQYPVKKGLLRRILPGGGGNLFFGSNQNYDPAITGLDPQTLTALQQYDKDN